MSFVRPLFLVLLAVLSYSFDNKPLNAQSVSISTQRTNAIRIEEYPQLGNILQTVRAELGKEKDPFHFNRKLFRFLHKKYFLKYDENADLMDLFTTNRYNCVTAVYLYATILDSVNIPYRLWLSPIHIYLTFKDGNRDVTVELTSPEDGFDLRYKESNIVDILETSKMITSRERDEKGDKEIIREFLEKSKVVFISDIPGILSYNYFIHHLEEGDNEGAFFSLADAYHSESVINDINKNFVDITHVYGFELYRKNDREGMIRFFTRLQQVERFPLSGLDEVLYIFTGFAEIMIKGNQLTPMEKWVSVIRNWFPDEPLYKEKLDEIDFEITKARFNNQLSARRYSALFNLAVDATSKYPQNTNAKLMLDHATTLYLDNLSSSGNIDEAVKFADSLYQQNIDSPGFRETYLQVLEKQFSLLSVKSPGKARELEKIGSKAESLDPGNPITLRMKAYNFHMAAQKLIRAEKYKEAKVKILAGLEADPSNIILLDDLRMVNEVLELKRRAGTK